MSDLLDLTEEMWNLICNVSGGNWEQQNETWQKAAARIRTKYHEALNKHKIEEPNDQT